MKTISTLRAILYSLLLVSALGSCTPKYVPNVINTPLLSNKGEFQASVHTGVSGVDPQVAYAVTDNIGIMANGSFANRKYDSLSSSYDNYHKHSFVEFGVGYYTKVSEAARFEVYGGSGFGTLQAKYTGAWISYSNVMSTRLFLQPTFGATTEVFDGSFSTRLSYVNLRQDTLSASQLFVEPALTMKLGYQYFKTVLQMGLSLPVAINNENFVAYQPILLSIGFQLTFGKKYDEGEKAATTWEIRRRSKMALALGNR